MESITVTQGHFKEIPYESLTIPDRPFAETHNTAVYKAKYKQADVAVKNSRCFSRKELAHHASLSHPNIVRFIGAVTKNHRNMIVMEFAMAGSLLDRLKCGAPIPANLAYSWSNDAVAAIHYLHENCIIHQDIKPANFLVFPIGLKACDFGFSRAGDETTVSSQNGGTMRYMAPERFKNAQNQTLISKKSDVYSLMIVIWEIMTGTPHFDGLTDYQLTQQNLVPSPPTWTPENWPDELKNLCCLCWQNEHCLRPTINRVREMMFEITEDEERFHVVQMANIKTRQMAPGYGHKFLSILTMPNGNFVLLVRGTSYTKVHRRCKLLPINCSGIGFVAHRHYSYKSLRNADLLSQCSLGVIAAKLKRNKTTKIIKLTTEGFELARFYLTNSGDKSQHHVSSIARDLDGNIYVMCRFKSSNLSSSKLHSAILSKFGSDTGEPLREDNNGYSWFCFKYDEVGRFMTMLFISNGYKVKHANPIIKIYKDNIYINSWAYSGVIEHYKLDGSYVRTLRLNNIRDFAVSQSGIIVALTDRKVALYETEYGRLLEEFEHKIAESPMVDQHVAINGRHIIVANKYKTKVFKVL